MRSALPPAPPERRRQWGRCGDVTVCRGQQVGPEGLRAGFWAGGEGGGKSPTMEGCSLLSPTRRVRELGRHPVALRNGGWWSGHPALLLASRWGRAGPLRTLAHLAALPFSQPFPGSMPWLSLSPGPAANPSRLWGCRVWHFPASPSLHPQGIPVRTCTQAGARPALLAGLGWRPPLQPCPLPVAEPVPGGAPGGCSPGGVGCSLPSEGRAHWAGGSAAGCLPASQSRRFLIVVVYL